MDEEMNNPAEPIPVGKVYKDNSTVALVLGICAIIPFVGIATAILAIIMGNSTLKGISAGDVPDMSKGRAQAGKILGIAIGSLTLLFSAYAVYFTLVIANEDDESCFRVGGSSQIICIEEVSLGQIG